MKKKIYFLILLMFILSGCSMNYKLTINEDLSATEEIYIYENAKKIIETKTNIDEKVNNHYLPYKEKLNELEYTVIDYRKNDNAGKYITQKYDTISDYIEKVKNINQYFKEINFKEQNDLKTISFNSLKNIYSQHPDQLAADENTLTLIIPFEIINTKNLNCYKKENYNECSVELRKKNNEDFNVKVSFDSSKKIIYQTQQEETNTEVEQPKKDNTKTIIICSGLIFIGLISYIIFSKKEKNKYK